LDYFYSIIVFLFLNGTSGQGPSRRRHTTFQLGIGFESPQVFPLHVHVSILTSRSDPLDEDCSGEPVITTRTPGHMSKDPVGHIEFHFHCLLILASTPFIWIFPLFTNGGNYFACLGWANGGDTFTFTGACFIARRAPSSQSPRVVTPIGDDSGPLRISKS
jgi:hypothetical protein